MKRFAALLLGALFTLGVLGACGGDGNGKPAAKTPATTRPGVTFTPSTPAPTTPPSTVGPWGLADETAWRNRHGSHGANNARDDCMLRVAERFFPSYQAYEASAEGPQTEPSRPDPFDVYFAAAEAECPPS
jgi:hypothetical protein